MLFTLLRRAAFLYFLIEAFFSLFFFFVFDLLAPFFTFSTSELPLFLLPV